MSSYIKGALLTLALALGLPALAAAQAPATSAGEAQEVEGWLREIEQLHLQLENIQREALRDPELSAAQEALGQEIRIEMDRIDPAMDERMARIEALESEAASAQQQGDGQKLQQLMVEAQQIQHHFMAVQQQALEKPQIAAMVVDFQTRLERRMIEVNPQAQSLIDRFRELEEKLAGVMGTGA